MTRTRPYTEAGLPRVPCARCGRPSRHQWSLRPCAIGKTAWHGLCREHDLQLNLDMLSFFKVPDAEALMAEYERKSA